MSDLISRCELFNRLATIAAPPEANDLKAEIYKVIQSMETVEPKVGEWIPVDMTCNHAHEFKCTACGNSVWYDHYTRFCEYDYCPNCGADMR